MTIRENGALCCCEYVDDNGDKNHVLAACCNCQHIDDSCERLITCQPLQPNACERIMSTVKDRLRVPFCDGQGARRIDHHAVVGALAVPLTLVLAAQGWEWMFVTFCTVPLLLLYLAFRFLKSRTRTQFFFSWSITSFAFLLGVFQLEVVPYLEILFTENLLVMCFMSAVCICVYFVKQGPGSPNLADKRSSAGTVRRPESTILTVEDNKYYLCQACNVVQPPRCHHCNLCNQCVCRLDHHCLWLDECIGADNHRSFILGMIALCLGSAYASNLTLTTICHPTLFWGTILLPDNCSDVYGDFHIALCFISAVYGLIAAVVVAVAVLFQLWLACQNATTWDVFHRQVGLYNKRGIIRNTCDFWRGHY